MKVREANALLNKLNKSQPDAELTLWIPTDNGAPAPVEPSFEAHADGIAILPKELDDAVKAGLSAEQVNKIAQREVYAPKGDQTQTGA